MGLDMYLERDMYIGGHYEHRNVKGECNISIGDKKLILNSNEVEKIIVSVIYWRKANQIHRWIIENAEWTREDFEAEIDLEKLKELADICKKVLEKREEKYSKEHLPTQEGFFFGSTDYDKYYYDDLTYTVEMLEEEFEKVEKMEYENFSYRYIASY